MVSSPFVHAIRCPERERDEPSEARCSEETRNASIPPIFSLSSLVKRLFCVFVSRRLKAYSGHTRGESVNSTSHGITSR